MYCFETPGKQSWLIDPVLSRSREELNEAEWSIVNRIHSIRFHGRDGRGMADASAGRQIAVSKHGSP
jgi:hypothetical protein